MGEVVTAHLFAGHAPVENNNNAKASGQLPEQCLGGGERG